MEIVKDNFNLFTRIKSLPMQKKEPDLSLLLLGSILQNITDDDDLTFKERIEHIKMNLIKVGMYKIK